VYVVRGVESFLAYFDMHKDQHHYKLAGQFLRLEVSAVLSSHEDQLYMLKKVNDYLRRIGLLTNPEDLMPLIKLKNTTIHAANRHRSSCHLI